MTASTSIERRLQAVFVAALAAQLALFVLLGGNPLYAWAPLVAVSLAGVLAARWAIAHVVGSLGLLADQLGAIVHDDSWQAPLQAGPLEGVHEVTAELEALRRRIAQAIERDERLRSEAAEASRYQATFLEAVSHELKTPLNAILGFSEVLLSQLEGPLTTDQRENLVMIQRSGRQLSALFAQVIELATMASGSAGLERSEVEPGELLEDVLEQARESLPDRPIHLRLDVPDEIAAVHADRERLHRVLTGLTAHVLAVSSGYEVVLGAEPRPGGVALFIRDPARRTSDADAAALLDPESDLPRRRGVDEGTRLLLAISTELAELHGGALRIERGEGEAAGTRFVIELPAGEPAA